MSPGFTGALCPGLEAEQTWSEVAAAGGSGWNLHVRIQDVARGFSQMSHHAGELLSFNGREAHESGHVVVPVLLEGEVRQVGVWHLHPVLQQLDLDFRRMEVAGVTDEGVVFAALQRYSAVHLNLGRRYFGDRRVQQTEQGGEDERLHHISLENPRQLFVKMKTKATSRPRLKKKKRK